MAVAMCHLSPVQVYLSLKAGENDVWGIFVEQPVLPGTTILQIPTLASCLWDDEAPFELDEWAVWLAASFLDLKNSKNKCKAKQAWLSLVLMDLRESLPVHLDESPIGACMSRDLDLAIDCSYFARAKTISGHSAFGGDTSTHYRC